MSHFTSKLCILPSPIDNLNILLLYVSSFDSFNTKEKKIIYKFISNSYLLTILEVIDLWRIITTKINTEIKKNKPENLSGELIKYLFLILKKIYHSDIYREYKNINKRNSLDAYRFYEFPYDDSFALKSKEELKNHHKISINDPHAYNLNNLLSDIINERVIRKPNFMLALYQDHVSKSLGFLCQIKKYFRILKKAQLQCENL
jgi:hypothetical protein